MKYTKGLPKILNWKNDNCPPVTDEFFNITNVMELVAYTQKRYKQHAELHKTLKQVQSDINIVGEVSQQTLEKINSLLNELKS